MADKQEKELEKTNLISYVRGLDNKGDSVSIEKSALLGLFYELIELDCNDVKYRCEYFSNKWRNAPIADGLGVLKVTDFNGNQDWIIQELTTFNPYNFKRFIRMLNGGEQWTEWKSISFT